MFFDWCMLHQGFWIFILQDKTLFCAFEAGDLIGQSADCKVGPSGQPTAAEFVKLTQKIVIEIQRQSADLYKVQLCNINNFCGYPSDLRGKGIRVSPAWLHLQCEQNGAFIVRHACVVHKRAITPRITLALEKSIYRLKKTIYGFDLVSSE